MIFWNSYKKCFLATFISLCGGGCGLLGVVLMIEMFSEGPVTAIFVGAIFIGLFFALRKLADAVALRKYKKLAEEGKLE